MSDTIASIKKRLKKRKDFYNHLGTFVVISVFLLGLNLYTDPQTIWAVWPIGGWGIAVALQGVQVLIEDKTSRWEQKAIRQELEDMGYDPDGYVEDSLELEDLHEAQKEKAVPYKRSDLV